MIDPNEILDSAFDEISDWYAVNDSIDYFSDVTADELMDGHDAVAYMEAYNSEFGIDHHYMPNQVVITLMKSKIPSMAMSLLADRINDAIWMLQRDGVNVNDVQYIWEGKVGILYY